MTTNNQAMFPNYNPEISYNNSRLSDVKIMETKSEISNSHIVEKIWNDVFFILHDFETKTETKISSFLKKIKDKYKTDIENSENFQAMNEYNLVNIFNEVHDNLYYVWNNRAQWELIEKFNISSFEMLYSIMDTIWMTHTLHWQDIDMPVDKFSLLIQYIDYYNTKYFTQEDYILMAQDLEYKDLKWLYSGIKALNMADWIQEIDLEYDDTVNILMFTHEYITKNLNSEDNLSLCDLKIIYENYFDQKVTNISRYSFSSVKRLLSMFGYNISDSQIELKAA